MAKNLKRAVKQAQKEGNLAEVGRRLYCPVALSPCPLARINLPAARSRICLQPPRPLPLALPERKRLGKRLRLTDGRWRRRLLWSSFRSRSRCPTRGR